MFSFYNDTVLDPFCGSGTTLIAALRNGRNSTGIEIDKEYCQMTARYLKAETNQPPTKAKLIFQKMTDGSCGKVKIGEDKSLSKVRTAKKMMK
ncbi:DNA modification methylase [Candidatus Scalindua japonica]|uniref:DNA modification methylase n=2 Tax=Candidatus Scalindua japonica TaxID=1284222 RepID=A0A286U376_9BACT|nr:DNA modification methylase [Candidatus Scalindua japonica]